MPQEKKRAYIAVALAVTIITVSGPLIKIALNLGASPAVISFYRLLFAGGACLLISMRDKTKRRPLQGIARRDLGLIVLGGALLACHYLAWIPSLTMTSTYASVLLCATQPIFSIIGAFIFFRERTPGRALLALGVSALGIVLIAASDYAAFSVSPQALLGDLLALCGAFFSASYFLCGRSARQRIETMRYLGLLYLTTAALLAVYILATGGSFAIADARIWLCVMGLAFVCTLCGHSMLNWSLKYLPSSVITMGLLGEPLGAAIWAALFFGERVSLPTLIGGLIVIAGVLLYTIAVGKADAKAKQEDDETLLRSA